MSFSDIKAQDKAITLLKGYIKQSRIASSYLFTGPDAVGKNLTARTFAKALNCEREILSGLTSSLDSCDSCPSCLKMDKLAHPDLHLIAGEFNQTERAASDTDKPRVIKIEDIRQLQRDIGLKPYEASKKIFIIDNAHYLTPEASNALLKILEEPRGESLIILISHKPALLFKTIVSRCQILKFYPLSRNKLKEILEKDYGLDGQRAHFLSFFSEGRLGLALRLKEKDILREKNKVIDEFVFLKNPQENNSLAQDREALRSQLNMLALWFRDIYLSKIGLPVLEIINLDRRDDLHRLMSRYSFAQLDRILKSISDCLLYLQQNINIKLLLSHLKWSLKG